VLFCGYIFIYFRDKNVTWEENIYRKKYVSSQGKKVTYAKNNIFSDSGAGVKWAVTFSM
jgi:hypothetical protein